MGLTLKLTETKGYDFYFIFVEIHKELTNLAKQNDCKSLEPWVQPCVNHLFWSATSTFDGNGNVIWAKFKSFLSHVIDKHDNLDDPLFNRCEHAEINDRFWLKKSGLTFLKVMMIFFNCSK